MELCDTHTAEYLSFMWAYNTTMLPFSSNDWITAWHETLGKEWELVSNNLARKGNELIIAGGYEVADYLDIIHPEEIAGKFHGMRLVLRNVPQDSPTVKIFKMEKEDTTPISSLPPQLDKKNRHEMERKIRKFEREHTDIDLHDGNIDTLLTLMKLDPRKKEFLTPDMENFFRRIVVLGSVTELWADNHAVAAMLWFREEDMIMTYNSGYSESLAGFYLKARHMLQAAERGIKKYNFLQGNERYKYELGGKDFLVYRADILL